MYALLHSRLFQTTRNDSMQGCRRRCRQPIQGPSYERVRLPKLAPLRPTGTAALDAHLPVLLRECCDGLPPPAGPDVIDAHLPLELGCLPGREAAGLLAAHCGGGARAEPRVPLR